MGDVLGGLRERAADLERLIDGCRRKMSMLEADLSSMKAVLAFHAQSVGKDEFLPHMSVRRLFGRNEIMNFCRDALQEAGAPLDTRELTESVIARKGLDVSDDVLRKKVVYSVAQALKTATRKHLVEQCGTRRGVRLWRLLRSDTWAAARSNRRSEQ